MTLTDIVKMQPAELIRHAEAVFAEENQEQTTASAEKLNQVVFAMGLRVVLAIEQIAMKAPHKFPYE